MDQLQDQQPPPLFHESRLVRRRAPNVVRLGPGNRTNLYSLDLESGEITQITDLSPDESATFLTTTLNPTRAEAYYWCAGEVRAVDLQTLRQRTLWRAPDGFCGSMLNCTADGQWVCLGIYQDFSDRFRIDLARGYIGFREIFEARPESRVMKVAVDHRGAECVWAEKYWIGHVNTSPTQPHLLTFCHEGPWNLVDNRIWGLDLESGKAWPIRPREGDESVGHEYWHADGVHLGYHGRYADGDKFFGRIRFDNEARIEIPQRGETGHIHSNDFGLIVGDGGGVIRVWQRRGETFDLPRVLAEHRSSMKIQQAHPHPRFRLDGSRVVFTSDWTGYCQVYEVAVPDDVSSLPEAER